jgi:hypothetical protein
MPSKRKRSKKAAAAVGAVGISLSAAGGAPADAIGTPSPTPASSRQVTLNEEEISDVSLGTFYTFDKEAHGPPRLGDGCRVCWWNCRCGATKQKRNAPKPK